MIKGAKVIFDVLAFIGVSAAASFGVAGISSIFEKFRSSSKLDKLTNTLAVDPETAAVVYGAINKFADVLGLNRQEVDAAVLAIRLIAHVSPQALNVLYQDGTVSTLDDIVKFADYTSAKSFNIGGMTEAEYMAEIAKVIGTSSVTGANTPGATGDTTLVTVQSPAGPVQVPAAQASPNVQTSSTTSPDALGETPWYTLANPLPGYSTTDVGTNNAGVSIHTYVIQQALILAGFGKGVYEGENLPLLAVTGKSVGTDANTVYFNMLLGDYYEAIGEPRRRSYNIKLVYQLYKDIIAAGESGALVDQVKSKLAGYMDAIDPTIKTATSMYAFKRPRDRYAYGSVTALGSETEKWNLGAQPSAEAMIDIERALIDIGYYAAWDSPQSSRTTWSGIEDDSITGGTVDGKLKFAQGTNGAYRNQKYSWISVNNMARALADSGVYTDAQVKTWYASRAWNNDMGKALRILLEDIQPDSAMLSVFTEAKYPD